MAIPYSFNPMGVGLLRYAKDQILINWWGDTPQSGSVLFKPGVYWLDCVAAGGGGGNNGYSANGGGGGGGAGFKGWLNVRNTFTANVSNGGNTGANVSGASTVISGVMTLTGGQAGGNGTGKFGKGGVCTLVENNPNFFFSNIQLRKNGYPGNNGKNVGGDYAAGANSVRTDTGGGKAGGGGAGARSATVVGAGGAGGIQWDGTGGNGKGGLLFIRYLHGI